ncbi:TPA: P-type DNA transfer ATPase VirB11 [Stenotrophomonas maltophilia]|nr:P-type DNA transfer ATPase VirB11 [Stenotrophomonas maltophilia]
MNASVQPKPGVVSFGRDTSVRHLLKPLQRWFEEDGVTEICVNRPGEVFIEKESRWERFEVPELTFDALESLATAVSKLAGQEINESHPMLSAVLPGRERVQVVSYPACEHGTVSLTVRRPSFGRRTLDQYQAQGFFSHIRPISEGLTQVESDMEAMLGAGDYMQFLRSAVQHEKVIVVAGATGSGKTTFMKALMQEIPTHQRIITIEDTPELFLPDHPNHVHLFYPSEAKEEENASTTAATCLKSCMRMKPDRILLAELRGGETYDFVNVCASGHGGSITSLHAGSCEMAFERMALMILQNRQGRTLPYEVIRRLLYLVVDVVVHVHNEVTLPDLGRHITGIWFQPMKKRQG